MSSIKREISHFRVEVSRQCQRRQRRLNVSEITVEPILRGYPQDQGKCPLNRGVSNSKWRLGWGLLIINQQIKYFSFILSRDLLQLLFQADR